MTDAMVPLKCWSVDCSNLVTHMESFSDESKPLPWCCAHYTELVRLKRTIAQKQHEADIEIIKAQVAFLSGLLRKHGIAMA